MPIFFTKLKFIHFMNYTVKKDEKSYESFVL
jgi:hypothetical protein